MSNAGEFNAKAQRSEGAKLSSQIRMEPDDGWHSLNGVAKLTSKSFFKTFAPLRLCVKNLLHGFGLNHTRNAQSQPPNSMRTLSIMRRRKGQPKQAKEFLLFIIYLVDTIAGGGTNTDKLSTSRNS